MIFRWLSKIINNIRSSNKSTKTVPDSLLVERSSFLARFLHWFHLITFIILTFTGLVFYFPFLALGRIGANMSIHRGVGLFYVIVSVAFMLRYFNRFLIFISSYASWQKKDLSWLLKFPSFMLAPKRLKLPKIAGKIDSGQKLVASMMLLASFLMGLSGLIRLFPNSLPAGLVFRGMAVHQITFPFLLFFAIGHIFIGSGIHPIYRGVWRAMLGDGKLRAGLIKIHWKKWLDNKLAGKEESVEDRAKKIKKGWLVMAFFLLLTGIVFTVLLRPFPWQMEEINRVEEMPAGNYLVEVGEEEIWVKVGEDNKVNLVVVENNKALTSWQAKQALIEALLFKEGQQ